MPPTSITFYVEAVASFELCRLRRGFTIAQIEPSNATMTYGCELTSNSSSEYHFFSSYESANRNQTVVILLARESRQPKCHLRLFLVSYEYIHWRVTADSRIAVDLIRLSSPPGTPNATIDIDATSIILKNPIRRASFYSGIWPPTGQFVEWTQRPLKAFARMKKLGHLRSLTAVWKSSIVTIPLGVSKVQRRSVAHDIANDTTKIKKFQKYAYTSTNRSKHWKHNQSNDSWSCNCATLPSHPLQTFGSCYTNVYEINVVAAVSATVSSFCITVIVVVTVSLTTKRNKRIFDV
ncbi:uncharacterized protein LOC134184717 [Corticium candelabrum]|uniref:uncharacterized protein LOC134184717 n=1 Tax=Corticium candelabrum TaxID=121492 RepID=UPI002E374907|nr:uncharacterized protein LOC134184717 [Corticium candelabrum]